VLAGLVPQDIVKPLWGVIVSVELPQSPRHQIIEGSITRGLTTGKIENETPFTLLSSPSYLAVGSTLLEGSEPRGEEWAPRLLSRGTRFVPSIEQARVHSTLVCARPKSFDNRPILGRVPGQDRLWIASGHGGRGMSLSAASGRLMADALIAGSDAAIPVELSAARLSDL
jgi:glycine/D-amino acid oxidase-like deaminating enzyme